MSVLFQAPSNVYSAQLREFGPFDIDPVFSRVQFTLTRENWPAGNIGTFAIYVSYDGVTWPDASTPSVQTSLQGGSVLGRDGVTPKAADTISVSLAQMGNPNRKMKIVINNTSQLRTAVTVEAS